MILSLTRAAAAEIGSRDTGVPDRCCTTLHARCLRLCDRPRLIRSKEIEEWNENYPAWSLSPAVVGTSTEAGSIGAGQASRLFQECEVNLARMEPVSEWDPEVRDFHENFSAFKAIRSVVTFTDLLTQVQEEKLPPLLIDEEGRTYSPAVILVDEVQDFSKLEIAILEQWAPHVEQMIMVGDLHQMIYEWRGATADTLLSYESRILDQSYRVPRAIHKVAMELMEEIGSIPPVSFKPRDAEGAVLKVYAVWDKPYSITTQINIFNPIMIIAACDYMLQPLVRSLKEEGIPFWNPFAITRAKWNPLTYRVDSGRLSFPDMLRIYLRGKRGHWTPAEMKAFMPIFKGVLRRGGKKILDEIDDFAPSDDLTSVLIDVVRDEHLNNLYECDLMSNWMERQIHTKWVDKLWYVQRVVERFGLEALDEKPKVIVGTIHSVKGGECDTVLVFPDIGRKFNESYYNEGISGRDAILRLFYVAVTRARETLLIGAPSSYEFCREI